MDYRGELTLKFRVNINTVNYQPVVIPPYGQKDQDGELMDCRIGQLIIMPYPDVLPEWAEELTITERGEGGYGSTKPNFNENGTETADAEKESK